MILFGIALLPTVLLAAAVIFAVLLLIRPALPVRWALTLFVRSFYRMRVIGAENVPAEGPALLVCNHVSYIDWLLLVVAQRRVIRFVVFAGWTNTPVIRHLLRWGKVIPIDASSGPRAIVKSLQAAGEALKRGDLVCIFAEGRFTRTGFLLPFRRGFEEIAKRGGAPIIPVCLDELWGSIFSFYGDRCLWKLPRQLPYSVTVAFGKPMPAETSAEQVRLAVQQLAADAAIARSDELLPVHRQFVRSAARRRFRPAIGLIPSIREETDIQRVEFYDPKTRRNGPILARCILLTWRLRRRLQTPSPVAIWLPQSVDTIIANVVVALCGKASVNLSKDWSNETIQAAIQKCNSQQVLVANKYRDIQPLPHVEGVEFVDIDELVNTAPRWQCAAAKFCAYLPGLVIDRLVLRLGKHRLDDVATILFTDADANPRGLIYSHRSLSAAAVSSVKAYDLTSRDDICAVYPPAHCLGLTVSIWASLSSGMVATCMAQTYNERTDPELQAARKDQKCFVMRFRFGRCQRLVVGSPFCSDRLDELYEDDNPELLEAYYVPELATIVATNVPDKTLEGFTQIGNKPGTVGQPLAGMAARVVNPETFEVLPAGQDGLLQFRSASLMVGYLNDEEATRKVIRDGWFCTSEIAHIDEQGFITIVT